MKPRLIFLCGALRSGTTLMRLMLNSHSQITNPGEFDFFFDYVFQADDAISYQALLEKDRIFQYSSLSIDPAAKTYQDVLDSFVRQCDTGKPVVCINLHRNFELARQYFPEANFIHLNRDPRDVALSTIGMGWTGHVHFGVEYWLKAEQSWDRLVSELKADYYIELSYEALITDTQGELSTVCQYLGLEYQETMMDYPDFSTYSKPDKKLIAQWKRKMSPREIGLVERKTESMLKARGYEYVGEHTGAPSFFESIALQLTHRKYRINFNLKRYGFGLYLAYQITRRIQLEFVAGPIRKKMQRIAQAHAK